MAADTGHKITIGVEGTTPGTYEIIGDVQSIDLPGVTRGTVDVTTLADDAKKFIGTIPEAGDLSIEMFYDETSAAQEKLIASVEDRATRRGVNYQVTFPSTATWEFNAIPTAAEIGSAEQEAAKMLTFTAKLNGGRGTVTAP